MRRPLDVAAIAHKNAVEKLRSYGLFSERLHSGLLGIASAPVRYVKTCSTLENTDELVER